VTRQEEMRLIRRILAGETQLFEAFFNENQTAVYNLALRMTGSEQDALDASQDAFLKAFHSLSSFRGDSKFSVWLYRLTSNACLDLLRRRSRRSEVSLTECGDDDEAEPAELSIPDERFCPETELDKKELREAVQRAVVHLPPDFQQALLLREVSGLSYEEIAETLQLESGTVKSRIFRARKKLIQLLMADGNFSFIASSDGKEAR
jgi:RNA polymerase sigma factor (sigma-70 family)